MGNSSPGASLGQLHFKSSQKVPWGSFTWGSQGPASWDILGRHTCPSLHMSFNSEAEAWPDPQFGPYWTRLVT